MSDPTTSINPSHPTTSFEPDSPVNVILAEYLEACRQGQAPSREELLAKHPEFAKELDSFLSGQAALRRVAPTQRSPMETATFDGRDRPIAGPGDVVRYFGDYELLSEIARGGMGVVYRARQVSLNRIVALKMILSGQLASSSDVTRFRAEAEAAANLDHPSIVPMYEVGEHLGQHYFSMKLVDGGSLSHKLAGTARPAIRDLVAKLAVVARAVHYAHQRGIMHRDLKPANILLDSQGQPHISDFGLAKHVTADSHLTMSGSIVGTPSYMPPEQALGSKGLTVVADVYSLGAMLYEFLTGKPPFKGDTILETLRQVREQEPVRPRAIDPSVDRDLETIALKCLEKEPSRRYESAGALADELDCWLEGKPISARPTTATERAWKWARRRPAIAGLIAAVAASLLVGTSVATAFAIDANNQANLAREAEADARKKADAEAAAHARAETARAKEADALRLEVIARGQEVTAREAAQKAQKEEADARAKEAIALRQAVDERNAKDLQFVRADGLRLAAEADAARFRDPGLALLLATEGAKRTPSHLTFNSLYAALADCREERTFFAESRGWDGPERGWYVYEGEAKFARYLPGGKNILTAVGNSLRIWDAATGKMVGQWKGFNLPIRTIALSPDGQRVAVTTYGHAPVRHADGLYYNYTDRVVYVVDLAKGTDVLRLRGSKYTVVSAEFSRDGKRIVTASYDGHARVYDAATGNLVKEIKAAELALLSAQFFADGKKVIAFGSNVSHSTFGYDSEIEPGLGKPVADPPFDPEARPLGQSGHGEGSMKGLGGSNTVAKLWDVESGKSTVSFTKPPPGIFTFGHIWYPNVGALSPDGTRAAVAFTGEVTVWETDTGTLQFTLKGHEGDVNAIAFRPDGKRIATAGADKTIRLWDLAGREVLRLRGHTEGVTGLRFSPSGKKLVSWSPDRTARVWDVDSGAEIVALRGHTGIIRDADFRNDELRVTTAGDNSIRIWTLEPTKMPDVALSGHAGKVTAIAYSPDGKFFLTSSADQSARLWDSSTGKVVREFGDGRPLGEVRSARFSPDGTRVVTAAANRKATAGEKSVESAVIVWDVATGKQLLSLDALPTGATHAEFTPDGSRIFTVGDGSLRVQFQTQNEDPKNPKKSVEVGGISIKFTSSGTTDTGTQHLWDAKTGKLVSTLFKGKEGGWTMGGERTTFAFTPDGEHLFSVNKNGQMPTLYRTADGKELRTFRATSKWGGPAAVGLSPDGKTAIVEKQSEVALYDPASGLHLAMWKGFPGSIADFAYSQNGKRLAIASYKAAFIYDMPERKLVSVLKGHLAEVTKVAFSPDGSRVLTGAADDTAAVWETESGKMLAVCKGHSGKLTAVLFRADGQQVATLSDDGSARLWPVDLWAGVAARTPRTLTNDEAERFEVALAGQPKKVDWRDRIPQADPPAGTQPTELFTLAKDVVPAEVVQARHAALAALRAMPTGTPAEIDAARMQAHEVRRLNPGTVEAASAGELLTRLATPLAVLDAKTIAETEQKTKLPKEVVAVLGESRQREHGSISRVALSAAGKVVATRSWSDESSTALWDAETLDRRGVVAGEFLGFAADREELFVYTRSKGAMIQTWDVSGAAPKHVREVRVAAGNVLAISRDGKYAVGCGPAYDELRLWDLTSKDPAGRRVHKATTTHNEYFSAAFSPAADKLAFQVGGVIFLSDLREPAKPFLELTKPVKDKHYGGFDLKFGPDGKRLAARIDNAIVIWDVSASPAKESARLVKKDSWVTDSQFSADGSKLYVQYQQQDGAVWDLMATPPAEKPEFTKVFAGANSFALSQDANRVYAAIGIAIHGFDRKGDGWQERRPLVGPSHGITSLAFAADGRTLYAADDNETARVWKLEGNRFVEAGTIGQIGRWLKVTPDERTLVGGTYGFSLWDAQTRTRRTPESLDRRSYSPVHNSLNGDGRWLARGNFRPAVTLFDLSAPVPRRHAVIDKLGGDHNSVAAVAVSPDGRYLVVAPDQTNQAEPLQAWRITSQGIQPLALPYVSGNQIAFAPDGRTIAVADARNLTFVDLRDEVPSVRPAIELPHSWSRVNLLFTADGSRIVTVRERNVDVWNVSDGKKLSSFELATSHHTAALAPDGRHLAFGNKNGTIWIVRMP